MNKILKKLDQFSGVKGPVMVVVMDGVGLAPDTISNAVKSAYTPNLDMLMGKYPMVPLKAHGTAVGLPSDDDMGNSEVGHNALGAGQVFAQGAKLVSNSIESGKMFASETWKKLIANVKDNHSTLHFLGLFSDGNVHSHIDHLKAMVTEAKKEGVTRVRIHILLDGRDVGETSALDYINPFEAFLDGLRDADFDVMIASGGGRMQITMDRYEANWHMVEEGWKTHVLGHRPTVCIGGGSGHNLSERAARDRPGSARFRDCKGRQARRHNRGRRQRDLLQFPRRPFDRDFQEL